MKLDKVVKVNTLKYDRSLGISTAKSHTATRWMNSDTTWSEFLTKLSTTVRTKETEKEYHQASRTEKNNIKDVGGFVGGWLKEGKRRNGHVMNRSMLTLDIDYADETVLDMMKLSIDYSFAVYSTHSHRPFKPRYRLIIPLSRNVNSEEYEPIARKVAEEIGMDYFDDTSYEVARLMYWPSTSADAEFVFHYEDLPMLDVDAVLDSYLIDWRDPLEWPTSSREGKRYETLSKEQGDPLEKKGLVGAFCRAYSIHDVIEMHLSDVYEKHDDNRYTFIGGSTAGGLVVYDDKFAYSHHGTDPVSNKLVNSFDLLRVHKYGEMDVESKHDTVVTKLPSYKAMIDFVQEDKGVVENLAIERMSQAQEEFGIIEENTDSAEPVNNKWMQKLKMNKSGEFENTIPNISLIIDNDPLIKGKLAYNEFSYRKMRRGAVPWNKEKKHRPWVDDDDAGLRDYLERVYGIHNKSKTDDAVQVSMSKHAFHPVREYLDTLEWDGVERLEQLFIKYLGAENTELNRTVTKIAFTAAVARIYEPGIKFDHMTVLYGSQGIGKSALINRMGKDWFSDSLTSVTGKDAYEALQGAWLIEMGELSATKKADIESTKHFISKQEDRFRVSYGRHVEDFPRQCVFFGTTNDDTFLNDRTGNRRFWPISVDSTKRTANWSDLKEDEIDAIWAEAKHYYEEKIDLYLPKELEEDMLMTQEEHTAESPWTGIIVEYVNTKIPDNWEDMTISERRNYLNGEVDSLIDDNDDFGLKTRDRVCSLEVWVECLGNDIKHFPPIQRREINDILRNLEGWVKYEGNKRGTLRFGKTYGLQRAFVKQDFNDDDIFL